jgi:hypothetical protein
MVSMIAFGAIIATASACRSSDPVGSDMGSDADGGVNTDSGESQLTCEAKKKECVSDRVARICPADGAGWVTSQCRAGEKCSDGECKVDTGALCKPFDGACVDATTALQCKADGSGYTQLSCPANTKCVGGECAGRCTVGHGTCLDNKTLSSCQDGQSNVTQRCADGEYCVALDGDHAACKPAECQPGQRSCGDKANANADQTKFASECKQTPDGYKWVATQCLGYQTCNASESDCASQCTPGDTMCSLGGIITCGADGKWGASATACANNSVAGTYEICVNNYTTAGKAACVDPVCGTEERSSCQGAQIRNCDSTGHLGAAAACQSGGCGTQSSSPVQGSLYPVGTCPSAQCTPGESRCSGGGTQACLADGTWSAVTQCPSVPNFQKCEDGQQIINGQVRGKAICNAECMPGNQECTSGTQIRVCGEDGRWQTATACTVGTCGWDSNKGAACHAQCVPGAKVCNGISEEGTCGADGTIPTTTTACGTGTTCRTASDGTTLGCVQCIGSHGGNQGGAIDSKCATSGGADVNVYTSTNPGAQIVQCQADNTWGAATACGLGLATCYQDGTSASGERYSYQSCGTQYMCFGFPPNCGYYYICNNYSGTRPQGYSSKGTCQ